MYHKYIELNKGNREIIKKKIDAHYHKQNLKDS